MKLKAGLSYCVTEKFTAISTVHNSDRDWYSITHTGNPGNPIPRDCNEVYQSGCTQDGIYTIDPHCPNQKPFKVYCTNQTPSSREEWMDLRISLEAGQTMF